MYPELNPFNPGSGLEPPTLAGRDAEVAAFDLLVARTRHQRLSPSIILYGYRGVGKTVLLNAMRRQAASAGWLCIDIEGQPSEPGAAAVRNRLGRHLHVAADKFKNGKPYTAAVRRAFGTLTSFSLSLGVVGLELAREQPNARAQSGRLEVDLEELVEDFAPALKESSSAIGVFIDEMQDIDQELLEALLTVQNRAGQEGIPFYVVGAGLPSLPSLLGRTRSYAERLFEYRQVDALDAEAARTALERPFLDRNVMVAPDALNLLLTESSGYPYYIQIFGQAAWNATPDKFVHIESAQKAVEVGYHRLEQGIFPSRWDRAQPEEKEFLRSMCEVPETPCSMAQLAAVGKLEQDQLPALKRSLIEKGIIYSPDLETVAFTVPGMPRFIRRQDSLA
ncbi:ATP-binding protein [Microbacterium pygmaeum]|uniref:AAA ATPase domain-containing protein n=1 Tax=Microbacterium pygmaeum TaxID=370764 RepID=A0A1G7XNT9_9MICO|nr:ATP-binding protein [Microbacterium pygmaeum]SDG85300.1 AAA ATPase domain-containing protein [Microbacterium pygmaeum]